MGLIDITADYLKKHPKEDIVKAVLNVLKNLGVYNSNDMDEDTIMEDVSENMPLDTNGSLYDFISVTIDRLAAYYEDEF